jgi:uncharacterized protein (TIGR02996 family)
MARFESGGEIRDVALGDDRRAYCDAQRELLAAGWTRVRDPACEAAFPDDPRDPALEAAIRENPDDDQPWLVYADLLIERGHPRGPLVALESAPVNNIVQRAEREAEARRMRNATAEHFGLGLRGRSGLNVRWRRGFIHSAAIHGAFARGAAEDLLFDLLRHPCARFLRELELKCWHHDAQDHRLLVDLLAHAAPAPPLRKLTIEYATEEWTGFPPLGDIGALAVTYPALEILRLEGDDTTRFTSLALPRAKRFGFETTGLTTHALRAIAAAPWPALEDLELWFRDSPCTAHDLRFVLGLPNLTALRILAAPFADAVVEMLCASPIAARIAELDLRHGELTARGVDALVAARTAFPERFELRIDSARVAPELRYQLRDANIDVGWW